LSVFFNFFLLFSFLSLSLRSQPPGLESRTWARRTSSPPPAPGFPSELAPRLHPASSPRASFPRARPCLLPPSSPRAHEAPALGGRRGGVLALAQRRPARRRLSPARWAARQRARPAGFLHLRAPARPSFFLPSSPARPRGWSSPAQRRRCLRLAAAGPCPSSLLPRRPASASSHLGRPPSEKSEGTE